MSLPATPNQMGNRLLNRLPKNEYKSLVRAEKVAQRHVTVQCLRRQRKFEYRSAQREQPIAKAVNLLGGQRLGWLEPAVQAVDVVLDLEQIPELAGEFGHGVVKVAQSATERDRAGVKLGPRVVAPQSQKVNHSPLW